MYIEFRLPVGAGGMAAGVALNHINIDIDNWVKKHNIQYHKTKIHKPPKTQHHKYVVRLGRFWCFGVFRHEAQGRGKKAGG